jgi:transposase-like protein
MDDLGRFCCQNHRCPVKGTRNGGNISVCGYTDKRHSIRQLYCSVCKARFSERKGTVYYRSHLPQEKVDSILQHVQDGCGIRQTGRQARVKQDTVIRYVRRAGAHAQKLHEELLAFSPSDP